MKKGVNSSVSYGGFEYCKNFEDFPTKINTSNLLDRKASFDVIRNQKRKGDVQLRQKVLLVSKLLDLYGRACNISRVLRPEDLLR